MLSVQYVCPYRKALSSPIQSKKEIPTRQTLCDHKDAIRIFYEETFHGLPTEPMLYNRHDYPSWAEFAFFYCWTGLLKVTPCIAQCYRPWSHNESVHLLQSNKNHSKLPLADLLLVLQFYFWLLSKTINFGSTVIISSFLLDYSWSTLLKLVSWNLLNICLRKIITQFPHTMYTFQQWRLNYSTGEASLGYMVWHFGTSSIF